MERHRQLRVMIRHLRAGSAAAAVRQQRQVFARLSAKIGSLYRENTKFNEVVSRAARAKLRARLVKQSSRDWRDVPIRVEDIVLVRLFKRGAGAEFGLAIERANERL